MPRTDVPPRLLPMIALAGMLLAAPSAAAADAPRTGGATAPSPPVIAALSCAQDQPRCARGDTLTLHGEGLGDARTVTFLGRRGRRDDRRARPRMRDEHRLTVRVPSRARSGTIRVTSASAGSARSNTPVVIHSGPPSTPAAEPSVDRLYAGGAPMTFRYRTAAPAAGGQALIEAFGVTDGVAVARWPVQPDTTGVGSVTWDGTVNGVAVPTGRYALRVTGGAQGDVIADGPTPAAFEVLDAIFPIRGKHDLGRSTTNAFGGQRGHKGQDMFAACGTRLVAARAGTVMFAGREARAGNYVVISGADTQSYVYMHMRRRSALRTGQRVLTGQVVGEVGETGRASGCHLHFEMWTAPGWSRGGTAVDPLPELRRWDAFS